jgi:hypothetical protein
MDDHNVLIDKIISEKDKYNSKLSREEKAMCINNNELFTMENLKNVPKGRLVFLNENKGKSYCFDVIALKNYMSKKTKNEMHKNPYTNMNFSQEDINKILNIDVGKIKYFCTN